MSEPEIIQGVIDKNCKAEGLLHKKFYGFMFRMAMKIANNPMDSEDIVQDAFIKIFRELPKHNVGSSLKSWIGQIVWRTALTHYSRNKRERFAIAIEDYMPFEKGKYGFEERFLASDQIRLAMSDLQKVAPAQYTCFRLYYIENMDYKEIAEDIDISEGTVKSQISRALVKMRESLKEMNTIDSEYKATA